MLSFFNKSCNSKHQPSQALGTPDIPGVLKVLSVEQLLAPQNNRINILKELSGLSSDSFDRFYQKPIENFVRWVQLLPASEVHHHCHPGGLIDHTLSVCVYALKIRRSYVLSSDQSAENVSIEQDLWSYAIFLAALCHDLAKPLVDQIITIYDGNHQEFSWKPWDSFIDEQGGWYTSQFVKKRQKIMHEKAGPLITHRVVPNVCMNWLMSNPEIFFQWLSTISGDRENSSTIGEIVARADAHSVAINLGAEVNEGRAVTTQVKPLYEKMIVALRHLIHENELPLNRNGAAGWVKEGSCWLVSKRTLDTIREHLEREGHRGIPVKNGRLYDILQDHAVLKPFGDKAIWKVLIKGDGWSNELTVINIPVKKIWTNPENQPDEFEGEIQVIEEEGAQENNIENSQQSNGHKSLENAKDTISLQNRVGEGDENTNSNHEDLSQETITEPIIQQQSDVEDELLSFLPSTIKSDEHSNEENHEKEGFLASDQESLVIDETLDNEDKNPDLVGNRDKTPLHQSINADDIEMLFFNWVKEGVNQQTIKINSPKARVHIVDDGVILVTPGIFQDFSKERATEDWISVQKKILKKNIHTRGDNDLNVIKYYVEGDHRKTTINAIHFKNKSLFFSEGDIPNPNPYLERVKLI